MGTDINGWIEIALEDMPNELQWIGIVNVAVLLDRSYDAFGCLFGVQNYAGFQPLAPNRGLPSNVSDTVRQEAARSSDLAKQRNDPTIFHSPTWISWHEINGMNWQEESNFPDSRVHEYRRDANGDLIYETKALWSRELSSITGLTLAEAFEKPPLWATGQEWEIDGRVFRVEKMKRADVFEEDWQAVFKIMEVLAGRYGDENVRLVVWFDS